MADVISSPPAAAGEPVTAAECAATAGAKPAGLNEAAAGAAVQTAPATPAPNKDDDTFVDRAIMAMKAHTKVILADLWILLLEIKPAVLDFAGKHVGFLFGVLVVLFLIAWIA